MLINVCSLERAESGNIELADDFLPENVRSDIIKMVVDWQLLKRMSGCHKTKTISEVSGTGKKPFAQKGTGRARRGSNRAPQMRGGAVVHGPVVRSHEVSIPKKVKRLALRHALADKYQSSQLFVVDKMDAGNVSTKELLNRISWLKGENTLFVDSYFDKNFYLSCRNLSFADTLLEVGLNVYDILRHKAVVITSASLKELEKRLLAQ